MSAGIPTFDVPKVVSDVVKNISNFVKKVGEKLKDVQNKVMGKFIGKIAEAKKYVEQKKAEIQSEIDGLKSEVNKHIDAVASTKAEAEAYKAKAEKLISDKKIYLEYSTAKTQVSSLKGAYESSVKEQNDNYNARVFAINQNVANIKAELSSEKNSEEEKAELEESIVLLELSKKDLEEENQQFLISLAEERDAALVPAEEEVKRIEKELKDKGMNLLESELSKEIDMKNPTAALEKTVEQIFVKKENTETIAKTKKTLKSRYSQEKIEVMSESLGSLTEISIQDKVVDDVDGGFASGVELVEGLSAAVTIPSDVRIEQIKALMNHNKQLLNQLILESGEHMSEANIGTINEEQNLSNFSFDDYDFSTQCKGVKRS